MYIYFPWHQATESQGKSRPRCGKSHKWQQQEKLSHCGWYPCACNTMPSVDNKRTRCLQKRPMPCRHKDRAQSFWIVNPLWVETWLCPTSQLLPSTKSSEVITEFLTLLSTQKQCPKTMTTVNTGILFVVIWHHMALKWTSVSCCPPKRHIS